MTDRAQAAPAGSIGVWTNRRGRLEVSQRSPAGTRLYISIKRGRISRHNLEGLAFVF